ncbi:MAG: LysM peptidoglycan-binding domain-containing protein [Anaerolineae bacterium]|jgi:LysM repeat protein
MKRAIAVLLVSLLLILVFAPATSAAPLEWWILGYHVVQPGETLYCIGRAYGVDPWAIAYENGIVVPNYIQPGDVLRIPDAYAYIPPGPVCTAQFGGWAPCSCSAWYTITPGDTLYGIAFWYGKSMWDIAECNGILNLNYIRAGDTLCIP